MTAAFNPWSGVRFPTETPDIEVLDTTSRRDPGASIYYDVKRRIELWALYALFLFILLAFPLSVFWFVLFGSYEVQ